MANPKKIEKRKKQILSVAEKVFAKKGFQEATISEIAEQAKVSEASIYEYFTTKQGLLFSIPIEAAGELFDKSEFHIKLIRGAANKLRATIYLFMMTYQENPDFAAIIMLILKHNKNFLETEGHHIIRNGIKNIIVIIEEGIDSGEFRSDIDPHLIRSMILGTIEHIVTTSLMTGHPTNLLEMVDPIIDVITAGICAKGLSGSNCCPLGITNQ